jgi:geranylgeranyl diphosphate synthase, type II
MNNTLMKEMLSRYGKLTLSGIHTFIPNKEPKKYLYDLMHDYPDRGGKGFRPGLCIATCKAFGGSVKDAEFSAITLELLHNAFLIHDDVEDESFNRRNKPTMHQLTNKAIAINVGDAMNAFGLYPLFQNKYRLGEKLSEIIFLEIQNLVTESTEGQAMELGWRLENKIDLTEADYFRMILKKTCWYTCMHPIRIGALIGTKGYIDKKKFNRLGYFMGAAFQIQDDVLNLVANEEEYGKEIGGDILEGKRTLMLIHLMENCTPKEKRFLQNYLSLPILERKQDAAQYILELMHRYNSIEEAKNTSKFLAGAALKEFYTHFSQLPTSEDKDFLENIILYMINRNY